MAGEIFISYRRADEPHARFLYNALKELGVEAWYDAHVGAGEDWRTTTAKALQNARIFVLLFSRAAAASDDITKELAAATFSKKLVVPVRIEDIQPEGAFLYELAGRNWINAFENTEAKLGDLARSLATLVKSGKEDPAMLPFDRNAGGTVSSKAKKKPGRVGLMLAGAGLALAVAVGLGALFIKPAPAGPNQRYAFFGFEGEAGLAQVKAVATDTMFQTLASERMDTPAQGEMVVADPAKQLERAAALGAQYALTGEIHKVEDGKLQASIQLVDVPSKTSLWTQNVRAPADNPTLLADRIAYRTVPVLKCTGSLRDTLARDDLSIVRDLPEACMMVTLFTAANPSVWRPLAAKAPELAAIQNAFISVLGLSRFPDDPPSRLEEARQALATIEKAAPGSAEEYRSRVAVLLWNEPLYAEAEKILLEGRARWPDDSWMNYTYASVLRGVGRIKDSAGPIQASANADPLSALKQTYLARTMAASGQLPDEARRILDRVLNVSEFSIAWYTLYGAFLDGEDMAAITSAAPPEVLKDQVNCGRTAAAAALRLAKTPGKHSNVDLGCDPRKVRPDTAFDLFVVAGGLDTAFSIDIPRLPLGENVFLFIPAVRAARMDERFEALVTKLGVMDYWKATGRLPDFCATEPAPVCAKLKAAPKPPAN